MDAIVQKFRDLLDQSVELMKAADLAAYNLASNEAPYIGGDTDVKDGWETAVLVVKNQFGVFCEVRMGFEIVEPQIMVTPRVSAWYQSSPYGKFPVHTFTARDPEITLFYDQLNGVTLSDLLNEVMNVASLIEPAHLTDESWVNVEIPDPKFGEGTDRRPRG